MNGTREHEIIDITEDTVCPPGDDHRAAFHPRSVNVGCYRIAYVDPERGSVVGKRINGNALSGYLILDEIGKIEILTLERIF